MAAPKTDIQRAYDALTAKAKPYSRYFAYYDGNQPLRYVTDRLRDVFQDITASFTQNMCAVVVDSEVDRIHLNHFTVGKDVAKAKQLNDLFASTQLELDAADVHLAALVCGEAFVFVWKDPDTAEVEAYYNDPRLCHVFYDSERPRVATFAAKWWVGEDDDRRYLNLYYTDRIEYYVSRGSADSVSSSKAFVEAEASAANPYGVIPVFHFRRERRIIKSILANVIEPNDQINKLNSDMMVAAEFGAFKQRWAITQADMTAIKNAPDENWIIPAGDGEGEGTSVGQFDATDLHNYLQAIDNVATNIAIITRTPKHYFMSQGGDPSGEALIAMEAPLNKRAESTIQRISPTWAAVGAFMLTLSGAPTLAREVEPLFDEPATVQPLTESFIRQNNVAAGMPLVTILRDEGWTQQELDQMEADKADAAPAANAAPVEGSATTPSGAQALAAIYKNAGIDVPGAAVVA